MTLVLTLVIHRVPKRDVIKVAWTVNILCQLNINLPTADNFRRLFAKPFVRSRKICTELWWNSGMENKTLIDSNFSTINSDGWSQLHLCQNSVQNVGCTVVCLLVDPGQELFCGHFLSLNNVWRFQQQNKDYEMWFQLKYNKY